MQFELKITDFYEDELQRFLKGPDAIMLVNDVYNAIRNRLKHQAISDEEYDFLESIQDMLSTLDI